jgi:hypothetical protein
MKPWTMCRNLKISPITYFSLKTCLNWKTVLTWKSLIILATSGYLIRYLTVITYCFLCHAIFYRWTSCLNDHFEPKSFAQIAYPRILASASECSNGELAVIYVPSVYSDFTRRQLIRDTWAKSIKEGRLRAKVVFVLGSPLINGGELHFTLCIFTLYTLH